LEAKLLRVFLKFLSDESSATAIEYVAAVNGLGTNLNTRFTDINNSLK